MDCNNELKIKTDFNSNNEEYSLRVEEKIDNLLKVNNRVWLHYGLLFSNYYEKLKDDIEDICDNVEKLGLEVSNEMNKKYSNLDQMFSSYNLVRCVEDSKQDSWGREVFGYFVAPNKVYTVKRTIKRLIKYMNSLDSEYKDIFNEKEIHKVILAHEFFHFYEEKYKKTIYTKNYKVKVFKIFNLTYRSRVQAISEIAAMEFARQYTKIKYNPYILNYILLCNVNMIEADKIYNAVMELKNGEDLSGSNNI